jgi:lysophospholipase L1-like esterase
MHSLMPRRGLELARGFLVEADMFLLSFSLLEFLKSCGARASRLALLRAVPLLVLGCGDDGSDPSTEVGEARGAHSYASWSASSQDRLELLPFPNAPVPVLQTLDNQSMRQIVRISAGGDQLRVRLSNRFGPDAIRVDNAGVALSEGGAEIDVASHVPLTFAGSPSVTVAAGEEVWSDFIDFETDNEEDLAITLFSAGASPMGTAHTLGRQTTYIADGDAVSAESLPTPEMPPTSYFWLNAIDVSGEPDPRVVVTFGDSITDGFNSTLDENRRYPNVLSRLLASAPEPYSVVNAGISGNRVLNDIIGPSGVSRFERDALEPTGARDVVILLGINDIGLGAFIPEQDVSAEQITGGLDDMVSAADARGLRVFLSTLLPFEGAGYYSETGEAKRQSVNDWIRSNPEITAVIDFDELMADPENPLAIEPSFDSGDFLHPNDAGYETMAEAVQAALTE